MKSRYLLYFLLAALPYLLQSDKPPADGWGWFKLVLMAVYQGLLAMKAYQSTPPAGDAPAPTPAPILGGAQKTIITIIIALGFIPTFLGCVALRTWASNANTQQALTDAVTAALAYSQGNDGVSASYAIQGLSAGIRSLEGTSSSGQPAAIAQQAAIAGVPELMSALQKAAAQMQNATTPNSATEAIAQMVYNAAVKTR